MKSSRNSAARNSPPLHFKLETAHRPDALALHRFESVSLRNKLEYLHPRCRVAFALACAKRTAGSAQLLNDEQSGQALELADAFARGREIDTEAATRLLATLEASALDNDAQSSAIYALASVCRLDVDSPAWAAECAYNARDAQAQAGLSFSEYTSEVLISKMTQPHGSS